MGMERLQQLQNWRAGLQADIAANDLDPRELDAIIAELVEIQMEIEVGA